MVGSLKVAGALLLLACLALPIKSCTEYYDAAGKRVSVARDETPPPGVKPVTTRYYLLEDLQSSDPEPIDAIEWLLVAACVLPAAVVSHARRRPAARLTKVLWFMEPLLLGCAVFSVAAFRFLADLDVGSYVAVGGSAIYFLGWIGEARVKWRSWRRRRLNSMPTGSYADPR